MLQKALAREKAKTLKAEQLLEKKSLELLNSYAALNESHQRLDAAMAEVKEKQHQLLQSEKMASLGVMSAGVAHEINNPVSFVFSNVASLSHAMEKFQIHYKLVKGYLSSETGKDQTQKKQALQEFSKSADLDYLFEDCTELLDETADGLQRVRSIVAGLQSFARADNSEMEPVDVNQILLNTLKLAQNQLDPDCTVVQDLGNLPQIQGFPGKLSQVFLNLIVNANQAIEDNAAITISTSANEQSITICVADTGCGIAADKLDDVFSAFYTTKPVGQGTGLGLSISHGIVEEHGGTISVSSVVGQGTSFTIILPVGQTEEDAVQPSKAA